MNVFDAFCGACGGWSLGLERAGFRTVAACEIDQWRQECFLKNFPHVKMYGDIRDVSAERLRSDRIGPIDILAGSPPCQDASTANAKGKGVDGERTGLFFEFVRLVEEIQPQWVMAENVPGIRTRGIDRILERLERADYACWPLIIGADDIGAPHRRKRLWLICARRDVSTRLARVAKEKPWIHLFKTP